MNISFNTKYVPLITFLSNSKLERYEIRYGPYFLEVCCSSLNSKNYNYFGYIYKDIEGKNYCYYSNFSPTERILIN